MGLTSTELIDLVLDAETWTSWDTPPSYGDLPEAYAADLVRARERAGTDESVVTGEARIAGRRVAVVLSEFRFLAGSIGRASAERLIAAVERATREGLPLLAGPASGGTRMQEGTPAFVQMVRIAEAVTRHKAAGLPYLVYLRHPTTGGVMASWGSLGHVTVAEPGALLGFLGPKVYEVLNGRPFPSGVQVAENLFAHGLVDGVVPPDELAGLVDRVLTILDLRPEKSPRPAEAWAPGGPAGGQCGGVTRGADHPAPRGGRAGGRGEGRPRGRPRRPTRATSRRSTPGTRSPGPGVRTGRVRGRCSGSRPRTSCPSTAPGRASATRV
ncbi:carboxyl transferase domain-containing protein [Nocardioides sp. NPDC057764]|uniref:carboxyl transferase domain-containing protein n=1 Tax=Nocardioides sp. NPDC057764 TaxID=3346243 RepID=UPI003670AEBA